MLMGGSASLGYASDTDDLFVQNLSSLGCPRVVITSCCGQQRGAGQSNQKSFSTEADNHIKTTGGRRQAAGGRRQAAGGRRQAAGGKYSEFHFGKLN
ncbi:hypothetical protein PAJ_p0096 (plasmid) [Pantoea ananatis AJ13355]|uniref:Uncharacterized protein n=1 Tax=Pantoea ananatis (strain AJ13355) TaxID=932677 RepID=A0A0H3L7R7_PANAA|nr:hypothetical protein PAJ_p0096 [Pantoea ananatis AJ13355]